MKMQRSSLIYLSIISGLLLAHPWYEVGTGLVLLIAFIPLLFIEDYLYQNKIEHRPHKAFLYSAIAFFTWNAGATWWLWNATVAGMFVAFLLNTLLMSTIFWLFHITRRNTSSSMGYFALIVFWLVYEHFYMNGEINWPWLNLGADQVRCVVDAPHPTHDTAQPLAQPLVDGWLRRRITSCHR